MGKKSMEMIKENFSQGIMIGMLLFVGALGVAGYDGSGGVWNTCRYYVVLIAAAYAAIGIGIICFHRRKRKTKDFRFFGASGTYYISLLLLAISFVRFVLYTYLSRVMYYIVLSNIILLICLWIADYIYLKNLAKRLNVNVSLIKETTAIELPEEPKGVDEFYDVLRKHCAGNGWKLEIILKEIPGIVIIEGIEYTAKLVRDYSYFGMLEYFLVLTTTVDDFNL